MTPEIRHLLGGYATGTLTEAERAKLFAAALEDQAVFEALHEEQQLKDLLDDPEARGYLLAELDHVEGMPVEQPVLHSRKAVRAAVAGATPERAMAAPAPIAAKTPPPPPPSRFWLPFAAVMMALMVTTWFSWQHEPAVTHEVARNIPPSSPPAVQTTAEAPKAAAPEPEQPRELRRAITPRAAESEARESSGPELKADAPKPAEIRQDAAAVADQAKKEADLRAESTVEKSVEKRQQAEAPAPVLAEAQAPPPPAAAPARSAAIPGNAAGIARPAYQIQRLENGQYVPTAATSRFQAGDSIVILLPADPAPRLMLANGTLIALERDGDHYRSAKIDLAPGQQEFIVAPDNAIGSRARFAAADSKMSKAKAAAPTPAMAGFRIRVNVE